MIHKVAPCPPSSAENDEFVATSMELNNVSSLDNTTYFISPVDISTLFFGPYSANSSCHQMTNLTDGRSILISPALSDIGISMMDAPFRIGSTGTGSNGDANKLSAVPAICGRCYKNLILFTST